MRALVSFNQNGAGGARCCGCWCFPAGRRSAGTGSSGGDEQGLGWRALQERGRSGGRELGRSFCRTSGRTSTPSGMWSARFGTKPLVGDSLFCPTSCVSRSPSRNTCGWVRTSALVLMAKLGPRVQMGPARVRVGGLAILLAIELETACLRRSEWEELRVRSQLVLPLSSYILLGMSHSRPQLPHLPVGSRVCWSVTPKTRTRKGTSGLFYYFFPYLFSFPPL